jgi:hypothetical protein
VPVAELPAAGSRGRVGLLLPLVVAVDRTMGAGRDVSQLRNGREGGPARELLAAQVVIARAACRSSGSEMPDCTGESPLP